MVDYILHLAQYMLATGCRSGKIDHFINYIGIVASIDCNAKTSRNPSDVAASFAVAAMVIKIYQ